MQSETNYKTEEIKVKGNVYQVMRVTGKYNYINILKATNNPFGSIGKDFKSEDEAIANYKSPAMKAALIQIFAIL